MNFIISAYIKTKNFFILPLFLFFLFTEKVLAEEGYVPLAPIPTLQNVVNPSIAVYMKGIFTAFVGLAIILAVIMIVIGGIEYILAALPSAKSDGKKKITGAITGLLLILISAVLLNTINPGLLRIGLNLDKSVFSTYTPPSSNSNSTTVTQYCRTGLLNSGCYATLAECEGPTKSYSCTTTAGNTPTGDEQANRNFLQSTGHITVNNPNPSVTNMAGVNQATLAEVVNVQSQCNCDIIVTGGAETNAGHNCTSSPYNHCTGYKVDLASGGAQGTALSNFVMDNYTNIGRRSDGALQYQAPDGAIYALESNHWDVLVK